MQRLLKFATSPNVNRRSEQGGNNRHPKSIDAVDDRDTVSPCDLDDKLKGLSMSPPVQAKHRPEQGLAGNSSEPPSPRPSTTNNDPSVVYPQASTSPPSARINPTPTKSRRMAFFNSNRFSLDESNANQKTSGLRPVPSADSCSPTTPPSGSPQSTPPTHHRRAAVHLTSSPIRLLSPKSGGMVGGTGSAAQMTNFGDLEYMNTSNEGYRLTVEQRELVRMAWRSCKTDRGKATAGAWIFKRIFAHQPHLKRVFNLHELEDERLLDADPQFLKHAQVFTDVLDMIVECVDALDDCLGPLLLSYGSKHVKFEAGHGFRLDYWDAFAVAMTEYATNNWKLMKNSHRRAEALRAWRILVFFVVSKVKQGFLLEKKAREKYGVDSCANND